MYHCLWHLWLNQNARAEKGFLSVRCNHADAEENYLEIILMLVSRDTNSFSTGMTQHHGRM